MTTARATSLRRRGTPRGQSIRRWIVLLAAVPALLGAGCQVDGSAVIAPYRSPPLAQVSARVVAATAGVLALSPDGTVQAVVDPRRGVCFPVIGTAATAVCAAVGPAGSRAVSATFSPDGRWVALGQDVNARGRGLVWLVDPRTGAARPVPALDRPTAPSTGSAAPSAGPSPTGTSTRNPNTASYIAMVWAASGDLLLMSNSLDPDGARTRLVDVDPISLVPRVVAEATGPYEFQSGYLAAGGSTVLFTVYRGDQPLPGLVSVDLRSGARRERGAIGPAGTQLVPLAISPDGRVAAVGSATLAHPGPPRLLDVASGVLTNIPGLTGDFGVAAFSPDGARVAVASTGADGSIGLALAAVGAAPLAPARTLGTVKGPLPPNGRLSWSRFDVLSLAAPAPPGSASVNGWVLTG